MTDLNPGNLKVSLQIHESTIKTRLNLTNATIQRKCIDPVMIVPYLLRLTSIVTPNFVEVTELREALSERGLEIKGNKPVLVSRLKEYLDQHGDGVGSSEPIEYDPTNPTEDTEPATEFGDKNFVNVTPRGIKFSLSAPKPVHPSPRPPSPGPQLDNNLEEGRGTLRRSDAAAFFLTEVNLFLACT